MSVFSIRADDVRRSEQAVAAAAVVLESFGSEEERKSSSARSGQRNEISRSRLAHCLFLASNCFGMNRTN